MEPFVLRSSAVTLSVPTGADVERIAAVCVDPEIAAWTVVPSPYSVEDATGFVSGFVPAGWEQERDFTWAVRAPGSVDGAVLGMVGVSCGGEPGEQRRGELGYWTAPDARGRGLTTAAARLVVDWALDPEGLGLTRLQWQAFTGNWASRRVAWKLGFRFEGTLRRYGAQRGTLRDSWMASLLPDDPRQPAEPWPDEAPTAAA
ncbi:GNAT family N-acetyltransferase [Isoptericola dokdonensis]|jgi:RimJ/RimL family protein N-acetyltransferase|uniref:Putative ribosomal N-acetyltransferase YdaF n=1 Tax=Isoptericola dokdonensis DS-3 TaxID=1300344 RepID=A0A168ER74_9MICO|nr:GNAT family protein [Isoptericola dokdonensis]ANC30368.1 Putative ribosomal N-acetyltransferase YdaF [Isoptericola dokdonensis DS-3]